MDKHDTSDAETTYTQYALNPGQERPYIIAKKYLKKAYVHLTVNNDEYIPNPKFNNISRILPYNIKINYLCGFYHKDKRTYESHKSKSYSESRSPKGLTRKLLCELLLDLIKKNIIKNHSIILLEAEPSVEEKLLEMYKNMGFQIKEYIDKDKFDGFISDKSIKFGRGAVMTSDVRSVILWCNDKFKL